MVLLVRSHSEASDERVEGTVEAQDKKVVGALEALAAAFAEPLVVLEMEALIR